MSKLDIMMDFDAALSEKFSLQPEAMDKYHRMLSCFMKPPHGAAARYSEPVNVLPG